MKYRKVLLDDTVTTIIQETAAEITTRFPIEMEAMGTDKNHLHLLCARIQSGSWSDGAVQRLRHGRSFAYSPQ
ncbi:transposase [Nitrospira defluvii]|uniref:Transposase IS200-like domain-containing protein n=1 Tax=Nitrospira defluvii TaxID=330214 RepID=A0ABN7LCC0_9BACT|nr:hypothetical protein NSPZN2_150050 [Nitrospira defluvii]